MYTDIDALAVFEDGAGPALYVGGAFAAAGEYASVRVARYGRECGFSTYRTSRTTSSGCVPTIGASGSPSARIVRRDALA